MTDLEIRSVTFDRLKAVCSPLLLLRANPSELREKLLLLRDVLKDVNVHGLSTCWDYVAFPLLLIVDSIPLVREGANVKASGAGSVPAASSDRVAEAALGCLSVLFSRVPPSGAERLLACLQRISPILTVKHDAISEEIRRACLTVLGDLLAPLAPDRPLLPISGQKAAQSSPTADITATLAEENWAEAAQQLDLDHEAATTEPGKKERMELDAVSVEAQRSALGAEDAGALVGYIIHCSLNIVEEEVMAGAAGSRAVAAEGLRVVRLLTAALAPSGPAAVAFFVPGIVSALTKVLYSAGQRGKAGGGLAGAAGGPAAVEALQALVEVVAATMQDKVLKQLGISFQDLSSGPATSVDDALMQLKMLAQGFPAQTSAAAAVPQQPALSGQLRAVVDERWVAATCKRLVPLMEGCLGPLTTHPRASVREALAAGIGWLLCHCTRALGHSGSQLLLSLLLTLVADESPRIASVASAWLSAAGAQTPSTPTARPWQGETQAVGVSATRASSGSGRANDEGMSSEMRSALEVLLTRWSSGLMAEVRSGEASGVAAAQRLSSALLVAGPKVTRQVLLERPALLSSLVGDLIKIFTPDPAAVALLLHSRPDGGVYLTSPDSQPPSHMDKQIDSATPSSSPHIDKPCISPTSLSQKPDPLQPVSAPMAVMAESVTKENPTTSSEAHSSSPRSPLEASNKSQTTVPMVSANGAQEATEKLPEDVKKVAEAAAAAALSTKALAVALPRMPLASTYLVSNRLYDAVAVLVRSLGRCARASRSLNILLEPLLSRLSVSSHSATGDDRGASEVWTSWLLSYCAAVSLTGEILFGASTAWTPDMHGLRDLAVGPLPALGETDTSFEGCVLNLFEELTASGALLLLGHQEGEEEGKSVREIAVLSAGVRCTLECVGAAARALGPRFLRNGRIVRLVLVPTLERLADPVPFVRSAADAAISTICVSCGIPSLDVLISSHADYVVDSVCARVRDLNTYPNAPQLLAALLARGGVTPILLPLMAEPLRAALLGVSILARRSHSQHVRAFLACLTQISRGTRAASLDAAASSRAALGVLETRHAAAAAAAAAEKEAKKASKEEIGGASSDVPGEAARKYFTRRMARQAGEDKAMPGAEVEDDLSEEEEIKVMTATDEDEQESRVRQLHAAAVTAGAAADAVVPLLAAAHISTVVSASTVLSTCLHALAETTAALKAEEEAEKYGGATAASGVKPVRPQSPKLLPVIAGAWPYMLAALRDGRVAVVEVASALLAEMVRLGGGVFMRRRLQVEAWPLLARILAHGSAAAGPEGGRARSMALPEPDAPAAVARKRVAVTNCLGEIAKGEGASGLRGIVWDCAVAILPLLGKDQPPNVVTAAGKALLALAHLDADSIWLLLVDAAQSLAPSVPVPSSFHLTMTAIAVTTEVPGSQLLRDDGKAPVEASQSIAAAVAAAAESAAAAGLAQSMSSSFLLPKPSEALATEAAPNSQLSPEDNSTSFEICQSSTGSAAAAAAAAAENTSGARGGGAPVTPQVCMVTPRITLPALRSLLPSLTSSSRGTAASSSHAKQSTWPVDSALSASVATRAAALLRQIETVEPAWHREIEESVKRATKVFSASV